MNLRDLLAGIQQHQNERHQYHWLIAIITHIIILILCLTSKYWRPLLLEFASRYALRRTRAPFRVPVLKTRDARTCALSMTDEECEMEIKAIMGDTEGTITTGPQTSSRYGSRPRRHLAQASWRALLPTGTVPDLKFW